MLSSDIGHSKSVMRCAGCLRRAPAQFARLHCRKRAFEIRLRSGLSFREKLRQLSVKPNDERRAQHIGKSAIADPPKIRMKKESPVISDRAPDLLKLSSRFSASRTGTTCVLSPGRTSCAPPCGSRG